jgi:hypothetical protein
MHGTMNIKIESMKLQKQNNEDQWNTPGYFLGGGSPNLVEDRRQRERGSGDVSPLVSGSIQFENE